MDNPTLKNQPIAVGGSVDHRGVISTCSYEARAFGVRSAMPTRKAIALCPQLLVLPTRMDRYRDISQQMFKIYQQYTDLIEPLSLDEAFIDVSHSHFHHGSATLIATEIKDKIRSCVGITVSAGVAPNKFLAKIASDWDKPDGLFVISPEQIASFVAELPVEKIFGVGPVTAQRLHQLNLFKCSDIQKQDVHTLVMHFGKMGHRLFHLANGRDERDIIPNHVRKSISVETTFITDLTAKEELILELDQLFKELCRRIAISKKADHISTIYLKIKTSQFKTHAIESATKHMPSLADYTVLLNQILALHPYPIRLLGLGVKLSEKKAPSTQLALF